MLLISASNAPNAPTYRRPKLAILTHPQFSGQQQRFKVRTIVREYCDPN
jgi:hypothetical protein